MTQKNLTCITCPIGCQLSAELGEDGAVLSVTGNTCPRGESYARAELTAPVRTVTSTVAISGALHKRLPVMTSAPVPKERIFDVMHELHAVSVSAPVTMNDIIVANICGLGIDIIASRSMECKN